MLFRIIRCVLIWAAMSCSGASSKAPSVISLSYEDVKQCAESRFSFKGRIFRVMPSRDNFALFICGASDEVGIVMRVTPTNTSSVTPSAKICWVDDVGKLIAWTDDMKGGVTLANGREMPEDLHGLSFDPSGEMFTFNHSGPHNAWVARVNAPDKPRLISTNWYSNRLFSRSNQIWISGMRLKVQGAQRNTPILAWIEGKTSDWKVVREQEMPGSVMDLSEDGEWALLQTFSDLKPEWLVFHLPTGRTEKRLRPNTYGFFAKTNVLSGLYPVGNSRKQR